MATLVRDNEDYNVALIEEEELMETIFNTLREKEDTLREKLHTKEYSSSEHREETLDTLCDIISLIDKLRHDITFNKKEVEKRIEEREDNLGSYSYKAIEKK